MAPRSSLSIGALALGATALFVVAPGGASAFQSVVVNGQTWNVDTFTGTYSANASKFALPSAGGVMPWFGSQSLANQFASALGAGLGLTTVPPFIGSLLPNATGIGPFFAYSRTTSFLGSFTNSSVYGQLGTQPPIGNAISPVPLPSSVPFICPNNSCSYRFATATLAVPGPLPVLGAAVAFGYSRRLRRRLRRSGPI